MNSPQRAAANAMPRVRLHLGRLAAGAVTAAALVCFVAEPAQAMTRSKRLQAHTVAQDQEPGPAHIRAHEKKNGATAKRNAPAKSAKASPAPTKAAHGKSRRSRPVPEPDADPVSMKRASRERSTRTEQASVVRGSHGRVLAHETPVPWATPQRVPARTVSRHEPAKIQAAENKAPDTGDFIRAATGTTPADPGRPAAYAEGVAHPDEMDDQVPVVRAARPQPIVARVSAVDTTAAPPRVEGFGAEGATPTGNHRTLAHTMAAHRNDPILTAKAPVLSGAEQNEITDEAVKPMVVPAVFTRGGRIVMPAPLKGSRDVLVHQNLMADHDGLQRIQDDAQLDDLLDSHELARLPESGSLHVNPELPENRRYARPWTVKFAADMARSYAARFGTPLQVNSAVRTVTYQLRLMRVNGNAAAVEGDTASPHLTGQAIDIGKRGMSQAQLAWMRAYLLPLMQSGKIDVEEEFQQACFHVSVYRGYMPPKHKVQVAAVTRRSPVDTDSPATADDVQ